MFVRRDIWSLQSADAWEPITLAYARAIAEMKRRPADDVTSWTFQAAIHGTYEEPALDEWNQCQHASWWFLPWHRMYISWFERIVRSIVVAQGGPDDWALPYWNYSRGAPTNTLPPAFRTPAWPDGEDDNPLHVPEPGRNTAGINRGAALAREDVDESMALAQRSFTPPPPPGFGGTAIREPAHFAPRQFTGALENVPHNVVHGAVGGDFETGLMADPNHAAEDPIFWLHHSNIDRVWAHWRGRGNADPSHPVFLGQTWPFFDAQGGRVTMSISDVLDPARETTLEYRYDDEPPVAARGPRAAAAVSGGEPAVERRELAATSGIELSGEATVALSMTPEARGLAAAALDQGGSIVLTVEDIQVHADTGSSYRVYLGPPEPSRLVGHITFFGASHMHHHGAHGGGMNQAFDVTALVDQLRAEGRWDPEQQLTFVPTGLAPPPGEAADQAPSSARVGRVALASETVGVTPRSGGPAPVPQVGPPPDGEVLAWEDDPGRPPSTLTPVARPAPRLDAPVLPIEIADPRPDEAAATPGTAAFRWWTAAEALARGRDMWASLLGGQVAWNPSVGDALLVELDHPQPEFNAYYDRRSLGFRHDTINGITVWSAESPDIACHELGHAILDAIRPQLWDAAGSEPAAFHESFGDISALLSALQLPSLRQAMLDETAGKPWRSSRVSRIAEQLGWALRSVSTASAEPTCLRDASNSWFYREPANLPPDAPSSLLSSAPHSLSRVFTGAFLKALAGMFDAQDEKDEAALGRVATDLARILVDAVAAAPVVPSYYSQLAAHVLDAERRVFGGRYQEALRFGLVRHGVLALSAANEVVRSRTGAAPVVDGDLPLQELDGSAYGVRRPLLVHVPAHQRRAGVASAAPGGGAVEPVPAGRAAEGFVEDLMRQGRIEITEEVAHEGAMTAPLAYKTHVFEPTERGLVLRRRVFDCGLHPPGTLGLHG